MIRFKGKLYTREEFFKLARKSKGENAFEKLKNLCFI